MVGCKSVFTLTLIHYIFITNFNDIFGSIPSPTQYHDLQSLNGFLSSDLDIEVVWNKILY